MRSALCARPVRRRRALNRFRRSGRVLRGAVRGNVDVVEADWNADYFAQLESFPDSRFKDMVDASGHGVERA